MLSVRFYTWLLRKAHRGLSRSLGVKYPPDTVWWYNQQTKKLTVGSAAHLEAMALAEKMRDG